MSQSRTIPNYAPVNFFDWFEANKRPSPGEDVVLYPDYLNDYLFPETMAAAADILTRWGFNVVLPPRLRPLFHYGMLDLTKFELRRCIDLLHPFAIRGVSIVHLEPSELSVFRDELPNLFPDNQDGHRIRDLSMLIGDFMDRRGIEPPRLEGKAIFHGHCHQKAVLNVQSARKILTRMGLDYEEPQPGCCGMSGSFGMEERSYDVSMKIAEEGLLPAVRKSEMDTYIVADGFSCRTQILEGSNRRPHHLAELLQHAYAEAGRARIYDFGKYQQERKGGKAMQEKTVEFLKDKLAGRGTQLGISVAAAALLSLGLGLLVYQRRKEEKQRIIEL